MYPFLGKNEAPTPVTYNVKIIIIFVCGYIAGWLSFETKKLFEINSTFTIHQVFTNYYPPRPNTYIDSHMPNTPVTTTMSTEHCDRFFLDWSNENVYEMSKEILWYKQTQCHKKAQPQCAPKNLVGPLTIDFQHLSFPFVIVRNIFPYCYVKYCSSFNAEISIFAYFW